MNEHNVDIDEEIAKHLEWIETVVTVLGEQEIAEEELREITRHDQCKLGHWLDSDGSAEYRDHPDFDKLKESHAAFHSLAGDLVSAVKANDETAAVASEEKFVATSQQVIGYLHALQERVGK